MTVKQRLSRLAPYLSGLAGRLRRIRIRRKYVYALTGLFGAYLLFGWLALPGIVRWQAEKYVLERSGHHLTMDRPSFNPFLLSLDIKNLRLTEPDGEQLIAFKDLLVDFSITSLFRRAYVFDEIRLDGLDASLEVLPKDRLNWTALIEAFRSKEKTSSELPRVVVKKFAIHGGRLYLADRRGGVVRSTHVTPINLELTDLSTLPREEGNYVLAARTGFGARIRWDGAVGLKPVSIAGHLRIEAVPLAKLAAYVALPPKLAVPQGMAALSTQYRAGMINGRFNLTLDHLAVRVADFRLSGKDDPGASLAVARFALDGGRLDLGKRRIAVRSIALSNGTINASRDAQGRIDLLSLLPAVKKPAPETQPTPPAGAPWHYRVDHLTLDNFGVAFQDRSVAPAAEIALQDIGVDLKDLSEDLTKPVPLQVSLRSRDGGSITADGTVVPATPAANLQVKVDGLSLLPAQPYLAHMTTLKLVDGALSSEGHAVYDGKNGEYTGSVALRDLRIDEAGTRQTFLAWRSLSTDTLSAGSKRIAIRELLLDGLNTRLIIAKDKSVNLTKIMRQQPGAGPARAAASRPFPIRIGRLRIRRSQLDFADHSLALPFGTHIHALAGTIVNISSRPGGAPARLQIAGQIDNYGMARAQGLLDLFKPTDRLDIKAMFKNVEMTRLTPYSATFAGRRIDSGKLTLNLEYKIENRQLTGDNRIIMDNLTLGGRVKSPEARDLPLDLAIAILEDSDGRIDLGLPVSGSLDDPQFSYGQIVWKAIVNVLTKIVTSPFRALGALFGEGDKFDGIVFEAGRKTLTPPEREKLVSFAAALNKHPRLAVTLHGTWSDADRIALQDLQLRRAIAKDLGLSAKGDPGLLTPDQPKVQSALEDLYVDRFGSGDFAALKEGFRKANPGELEPTVSGRFMSVLTGLIGTKPTLSAKDIAGMKGADFHTLLYKKLQAAEDVTDAQLVQLAKARGEAIMAQLRTAHAPLERLTLKAPEKTDADGKDIPFKFDMAPVAENTAPPGATQP